MPETTPLQRSDPLVSAGANEALASRPAANVRVAARRHDITPGGTLRKAEVAPPSRVWTPSCCLPIGRHVSANLRKAWNYLSAAVVPRLPGSVIAWVPPVRARLADLPMPPQGQSRVLAARREANGRVVIRWSKKEQPPADETALAVQEVARLMRGEIEALKGRPELDQTVQTLQSWIDRLPGKCVKPELILRGREALDNACDGPAKAASERLLSCLGTRKSAMPRKSRVMEVFDEEQAPLPDRFLDDDQAPARLLDPVEEQIAIDHFLEDVPVQVRDATHALCRYVASEVDKLPLDELARVQGLLKEEIRAAGSWRALKDRLREPPVDGWHCCVLQDVAVKMMAGFHSADPLLNRLAGQRSGADLLDSPIGRLKLLQQTMRRAWHVDRVALEAEGTLLGAVLAFKVFEPAAPSENTPTYGIRADALPQAVNHPETREALKRSFEFAAMSARGEVPPDQQKKEEPDDLLTPGAWEVDEDLVDELASLRVRGDAMPDAAERLADEKLVEDVEIRHMRWLRARYTT